MGRELRSPRQRRSTSARSTSERCSRTWSERRPRLRGAAGRRHRRVRRCRIAARRSRACSTRRGTIRRIAATQERLPDDGNADRLARFLAGAGPTVVYFGKLIEQKGVQVLLEAMQEIDARLVVVGFGPYRAALEATAPPRTLFTGPLEHRHLVHLLPLADVTVVPSIFPEAFGMVAAEAAAAGSPPLVARHSGLAEVAAGLEEEYPERFRHLASFETGAAGDLARKLTELLALSPAEHEVLRQAARQAVVAALVVAEHRAAPARARLARTDTLCAGMGDEQRVSWQELIAQSRDDVRRRHRLHPRRRRGVRAARREHARAHRSLRGALRRGAGDRPRAERRRRADRIGGRGAHRPMRELRGGCGRHGRAAQSAPRRRARAAARTRRHGHAPVEPLAGSAHHRHAALPAERRAPSLRRLAQQHLRPTRARRDRRRRPRDRSARRAAQLPARSCSRCLQARRSSSPSTQDCTRRAPRCLRACSRVAASRTLTASWQGWEDYVAFLYRTGSITEHTQIWWSVRPHLAYPDDRDPDCDGQPELAEAQSLAAFCYAWPCGAPERIDEGEALPNLPNRLLEENMWRAIRYGLSGELLDFERGEPVHGACAARAIAGVGGARRRARSAQPRT